MRRKNTGDTTIAVDVAGVMAAKKCPAGTG